MAKVPKKNFTISDRRIRKLRVLANKSNADFLDMTQQEVVDYSAMSLAWFHERVTNRFTGNHNTVLKDQFGKNASDVAPGDLVFFSYDPKTKDDLPYYDRFPLGIVVDATNKHFQCINVHYLHPKVRIRLFRELMKINGHNEMVDRNTKITAKYQFLRGVGNGSIVKHAWKKYLFTHVKSQFVKVDWKDAHMAIFLPVEQFAKKSKTFVWKQIS